MVRVFLVRFDENFQPMSFICSTEIWVLFVFCVGYWGGGHERIQEGTPRNVLIHSGTLT